jgi:hypothetical protein
MDDTEKRRGPGDAGTDRGASAGRNVVALLPTPPADRVLAT